MIAAGARPGSEETRVVRVKAFNSEIVTLSDIYARQKRATSNTYCVCGACPPLAPGTPFAQSLCVRWPHVVPERRRRVGGYTGGESPLFHDQGIRRGGGGGGGDDDDSRGNNGGGQMRMAVVRRQNGTFKQFCVERRLLERSAWDHAFATTITRFQGSGTKTIILPMTRTSAYADMRLFSVSVLRAEERFIFLGDEEVWRRVCARKPYTRRSEMFMLLACHVARVHQTLAAAHGARHPRALGDWLAASTRVEREIYRIDRAPLRETDRERVWRLFNLMRKETLDAAGLKEL
jgi:hypothetical protein